MHGTALLFPGQGSQTPDMGAMVRRDHPALFEAACEVVGPDLFDRVEEGTQWAQPAIFCASVARWRGLGFPTAPYMAGHSLGELAALVAAGRLSDGDGLSLVALRGRLMQDAIDDSPGCGMLAVRAGHARAFAVAESAGATVANDNGPQQVILSGTADSLACAKEELRALGIRARRLPVAGAFHSALMAPAVARFAAVLHEVDVRPGTCTVLSCATAEPFEDVRAQLASSITAPVRWRETVHALAAAGTTTFTDVGPGQVLANLVPGIIADDDVAASAEPELAHA